MMRLAVLIMAFVFPACSGGAAESRPPRRSARRLAAGPAGAACVPPPSAAARAPWWYRSLPSIEQTFHFNGLLTEFVTCHGVTCHIWGFGSAPSRT